MTPEEFHTSVLIPALHKTAKFAPQMPHTRELEVLMTAISGVEANWTEREQIPSGMAHGLFQMQLNAIEDIIANPASAGIFKLGMEEWGIEAQTPEHLFDLLTTPQGDSLSVFLARLLLWCNPKPIPFHDEEATLFQYYVETWRPGLPNAKRFAVVYAETLSVV